MRINLINTSAGLIPADDFSAEAKLKLEPMRVYVADIRPRADPSCRRRYFSLIAAVWACLPNTQHAVFRDKEGLRRWAELCSGWCEPFLSPNTGEWVDGPKPLPQGDGQTLEALYNAVWPILLDLLRRYVPQEKINVLLAGF